MKPDEVTKAIIGALVAGSWSMVQATLDNHVSLNEIALILFAIASTFGAVWGVPNALTKKQVEEAKRQLLDRGEVVKSAPIEAWPTTTTVAPAKITPYTK